MKYIVGDISLAVGGLIFSPGEEISESDYPSAEAFRSAVNRGLIVAENKDGEPAAAENKNEEPAVAENPDSGSSNVRTPENPETKDAKKKKGKASE